MWPEESTLADSTKTTNRGCGCLTSFPPQLRPTPATTKNTLYIPYLFKPNKQDKYYHLFTAVDSEAQRGEKPCSRLHH